ncbi:hypothetical protein MMPV_003861 [Pyropia vietnamensis]
MDAFTRSVDPTLFASRAYDDAAHDLDVAAAAAAAVPLTLVPPSGVAGEAAPLPDGGPPPRPPFLLVACGPVGEAAAAAATGLGPVAARLAAESAVGSGGGGGNAGASAGLLGTLTAPGLPPLGLYRLAGEAGGMALFGGDPVPDDRAAGVAAWVGSALAPRRVVVLTGMPRYQYTGESAEELDADPSLTLRSFHVGPPPPVVAIAATFRPPPPLPPTTFLSSLPAAMLSACLFTEPAPTPGTAYVAVLEGGGVAAADVLRMASAVGHDLAATVGGGGGGGDGATGWGKVGKRTAAAAARAVGDVAKASIFL